MYVGIFGDVIFSVGHLRTLTLSNFKGSTGAEWVEHKVINGKAKPEYVGPKLKEYTCDILLDAAHGVNAGCNKWQISALCDLGKCARCTFVKWREGF